MCYVARVVVVLTRARQTVARSSAGRSPCGGLGIGAACTAVGAPGLAPGSVDALGWSSLVRYEAVVSRPW